MVLVLRFSCLFAAVFAGCAFSASAGNVAVKSAEKVAKVVQSVKTEAVFKTQAQGKNELATNTTDLNEKTDATSSKSNKKPSSKLAVSDFESEADHAFRKDLVLRINELILKTQKESPAISVEFTEDRKLELLKVFTAALGDGVEYVPALDYKPPKSSVDDAKTNSYHKSIIIATGKVLYLRVDLFNEKTLKGLRADSASIAELDEAPLGLVVDLRSANGYDYAVVAKAADLFIQKQSDKKLSASKTANGGFFDIPIILLVDIKTRGAAEVFAAAIVKAGRGICLGEPTAGVPFKKRKIMLANGDYLLIPVMPKRFAKFASTSLKPDIRFAAKPQISYERLKSGGEVESSDKCVARAVELIICLNAISTGKSD